MSDNQGKEPVRKTSPRRIALIGAGATALALFNIMTNGPEAPSQGVVILQYAGLAGGAFALLAGLFMMPMAPRD